MLPGFNDQSVNSTEISLHIPDISCLWNMYGYVKFIQVSLIIDW